MSGAGVGMPEASLLFVSICLATAQQGGRKPLAPAPYQSSLTPPLELHVVEFPKLFTPFLLDLPLYEQVQSPHVIARPHKPEIISDFSVVTCLEGAEPWDPNPGPEALGQPETRKSEMGKEMDWKRTLFS